MPSLMDEIIVASSINSTAVHIITFVNPLHFSVCLSVLIAGDDSKHFLLLLQNCNNIHVSPGKSIDIPIMFSPKNMCMRRVILTIVADSIECIQQELKEQSLNWQYPICGQPVLRLCPIDNAPKIKCHAKECFEQLIELTLVKSSQNTTRNYLKRQGMTIGVILS